eukprot:1151956-Pelagomonas_calceolata.AAC.3
MVGWASDLGQGPGHVMQPRVHAAARNVTSAARASGGAGGYNHEEDSRVPCIPGYSVCPGMSRALDKTGMPMKARGSFAYHASGSCQRAAISCRCNAQLHTRIAQSSIWGVQLLSHHS